LPIADRAINLTQLSGRLLERGVTRYTPAGIPVVEFLLAHASRQIEAGSERQVDCEMSCIALGTTAQLLAAAKVGDDLTVGGFLAARSLKRRTPILHVNIVEFVEGTQNGIQA
jgi:primosomal replication protein N